MPLSVADVCGLITLAGGFATVVWKLSQICGEVKRAKKVLDWLVTDHVEHKLQTGRDRQQMQALKKELGVA